MSKRSDTAAATFNDHATTAIPYGLPEEQLAQSPGAGQAARPAVVREPATVNEQVKEPMLGAPISPRMPPPRLATSVSNETTEAVSARADDEDAPLFELFRPRSDDPKNIRQLRLAVMAMGVVLIALLMAVILRIGYLMTRDTARSSPPPSPIVSTTGDQAALPRAVRLTADVAVQLPPDARLKSHTLSGTVMSLHYEAPGGEGIVIIDLETGQPVSHVRLRGPN